MLFIIFPLTIVVLTVMPAKFSLPVSHTIIELPLINALLGDLCAVPFVVVRKFTLKMTFLGDVYSFSVLKLLSL